MVKHEEVEMDPLDEVNEPQPDNLLNEVTSQSAWVSKRQIQYNDMYNKMKTKHKTLKWRNKLTKGNVISIYYIHKLNYKKSLVKVTNTFYVNKVICQNSIIVKLCKCFTFYSFGTANFPKQSFLYSERDLVIMLFLYAEYYIKLDVLVIRH